MRVSRSPMPCVAVLLLTAASNVAADAEVGRAPVQRPVVIGARWASLPQEGTWVAGLAGEARGSRLTMTATGDAVRLRDPRPDSDPVGMFLATGSLGRRIAGGRNAWLEAEAVGSMFLAIIGDVGVGMWGVGPGLRGSWQLSRWLALSAGAKLTVPFPLTDSSAAVRFTAGRLAFAGGWRDVRFLRLFGLPGRYASGPQMSASMAF